MVTMVNDHKDVGDPYKRKICHSSSAIMQRSMLTAVDVNAGLLLHASKKE